MRGFVLEPDQSYLRDGQFHLSRYSQPVELYERIEVLKGPSALLYGKSTPGGMLNLVTKRAQNEELNVSIQQEFASFGMSKTGVDLSGGLNESGSIRGRTILSKTAEEGWRRYRNGEHARQERFVGAVMLEADLSEDALVKLNYDTTQDEGALDMGPQHIKDVSSGQYWLVGKRDYIWDMPWSSRDSNVENIGFTLDTYLNDSWSLSSGYNLQRHQRQTTESLFSKVRFVNKGDTNNYYLTGKASSDRFELGTAFLDVKGDFHTGNINHRFLIGSSIVDYFHSKQEYKLKNPIGQINIHGTDIIAKPDELNYRNGAVKQIRRKTYGLYIQDLIEFNDHWHLLAGLRLDREESGEETHHNLLPKLGLMYHPTQNSTLYSTYSESFEPRDPVSQSDDVNYGKRLKAERGESFEIGAKAELLNGSLFVSTALFDIQKNNKVVTDKSGKKPITTQSGQVRHRGFELSVEGKLTSKLSILTSMMYLDGKIVKDPKFTGKRSKDTPKFSASSWLNYDVTDASQLSIGAVYVGERFGDTPNNFLKDAYVKVDLGFSHTFNFSHDQQGILRVNIDNLFNTDYLRGGCNNSAMFGSPRAVKATFQYKF